jgi:hypothetical protein
MTEPVRFSIGCAVATLQRSTKGSITGNVHVELGTFVFPDRGWSDFVVVILGWWLKALKKLVNGEKRVELPFMDGPYAIYVTAVESTMCTLECVKKAREPLVVLSARVELGRLISETERAATQLIEACESRDWQSPDVDTLRHLLSRPRSVRPH